YLSSRHTDRRHASRGLVQNGREEKMNRTGRLARLCFLAATASALAATAAIAQEGRLSDDVLRIGLIEDMSGVYADITGKGAVAAAELAVEEFGGKVLGKPVEVLSADHQNKPDIAATIARRWFDEEKLDAVLDVASSSPAIAVLEVAKQKE